MRYHAVACDYDGTLAHGGRVDEPTLAALERLRRSGRRLILVTGRELDDLHRVFPRPELFERIVAENGAVLYRPATREERVLCEPPPAAFVEALEARGVAPLSVGRVIVATWEPQERTVLDAIRELGLELHVIFNKGAVMVLPSGVNKASGLTAALLELGLSPHNAVGVGDAENDHAFLALCESAVVVANALPTLKERADLVTARDHGAGVAELVDRLVESDLAELEPRLARHEIQLGSRRDDLAVRMKPYGELVLIAGSSGSGKSTFATGILERLADRGYQYCIIDPEGDYSSLEGPVVLGDANGPPSAHEVVELLKVPGPNAVVNLIGIALEHRPRFFEGLFPQLQELRVRTGRPHWIVIDETHHLLPVSWDPAALMLPQELHGMILITVHPDRIAPSLLASVDLIVAIGDAPADTIRTFAGARGLAAPAIPEHALAPGEAIAWAPRSDAEPYWFRSIPPRAERQRHHRKYAEGELGEDRSFYFRGADGKLNLRAQNLLVFLQLADGVDDETWLFHLRRGDYSRWFRSAIKDDELATDAQRVERAEAPADASRAAIREAIERRYTAPS